MAMTAWHCKKPSKIQYIHVWYLRSLRISKTFFIYRSSLHICTIIHPDVGHNVHPRYLEQTSQKDHHHITFSKYPERAFLKEHLQLKLWIICCFIILTSYLTIHITYVLFIFNNITIITNKLSLSNFDTLISFKNEINCFTTIL